MRKFISNYSLELKIFPAFLVLFLFTRLFRIMSLPMFTDEAIYTRWSQIAANDAAWRFISLTDGKQPSFIWFDLVLMKFVSDPLLAGRLVSVIAGVFVAIGLYFLGRELFKKRMVGVIASFLYILFPMGLVYDRMALYDSLVALFSVWVLYFQVLLFRHRRLDLAMILGFIMGGAVLTKTSGFLSIYMTPFLLLLTDLKKKIDFKDIRNWFGLVIVSVLLAYGIYSILRLSPFFHIIEEKNAVFVYPFNEWIQHPTRFWIGNLRGLSDWAVGYLTVPIILAAGLAYVIKWKNFVGEKILLFLWFFFPFLGLAVFGKVLYPRFIFFMMMPILVLASYGTYLLLSRFEKTWMRALLVGALILGLIRADYYILTNFQIAPIPNADLYQYSNGWPAGGGVKELIEFLSEESQKGKLHVVVEGTFGSLPLYAIEIYLDNNPNITKEGMYPVPEEVPEELLNKSLTMPVYFIVNQSQTPPDWPLSEIGIFQKGTGDEYMRIYRIDQNK